MNLYLISQHKNEGYDTYSDAVVVAPDAETAKRIYPMAELGCDGVGKFIDDPKNKDSVNDYWVDSIEHVSASLIGTAAEGYNEIQVICASFHAG